MLSVGPEQLREAEREPGQVPQTSSVVPVKDQRSLGLLRQGGAPAAISPAALIQAQRLVGNSAVWRTLTDERAAVAGGEAASGGAEAASGAGGGPSAAAPLGTKAEGGADFNALKCTPEAAEKDLKELLSRLDKVPTLNTPGFIGPMTRYVELAKAAQKDPAQKDKAIEAMNEALNFIATRRLFEVNHRRYERLRKNPNDPPAQEAVDQVADESVTRANLWSKMNRFYSLGRAVDSGGLSLEASVGGKLFDGLDFGMNYQTNPILANQWKNVSRNYVERTRGEVHAAVFRGIHPKSVLTTVEWPIIKEHLEEPRPRRITALFVHIFDLVHQRPKEPQANDKKDYGEIEEKTVKPIVIMSEADWNTKLRHFDDETDPEYKEFVDDQNRVNESEKKLDEGRKEWRTGKKADAGGEAKGAAGAGATAEGGGPSPLPAKAKAKIDEINSSESRLVEIE